MPATLIWAPVQKILFPGRRVFFRQEQPFGWFTIFQSTGFDFTIMWSYFVCLLCFACFVLLALF